jgi:small multidrug resistance pump
MAWFYLGLAVVVEVIATTALKFSEGFSRPFPTAIVVIGYGLFFLLARIVQLLPLSVTYAVWSGAGVALATLVGWIFLGQKLDLAAFLGIALIVAGVVVIQFFSGSLNV